MCFSFGYAASINNKIQEAAYILNVAKDTSKAEELLNSALNSADATEREKLNARLYLAKIAEAKGDSAKAFEHYRFLKNNSQNNSLAYTAFKRENRFASEERKIKIARVKRKTSTEKITSSQTQKDSRFLNCEEEGELLLAQHIVYNCPDNSLRFLSKKTGMETWGIPFTDTPAKVFLIFDGLFLYSGNNLEFHKLGEGLEQVWRIPTLEVLDIDSRGNRVFVLDISGRIQLLDKNSGQKISSTASDGEAFFKAGVGLVGTYQKNGGISVFDSLLTHLWDYQIDGEILEPPVLKSDSVIFNLSNDSAEILYTRHYQRTSWNAVESGNAQTWYNLALRENSDSLWNKAIIYGARRKDLSQKIFSKYAETVGAKWIRHLPVSSKMLYPQISSDANWLFVLDAESQELLKFSLEAGSAGGSFSLPKDRKYFVTDYEPPWLTLNSDYRLLQFSLKEQKTAFLDIPGKPISFLRDKDFVYVGLLNGFVLKYYAPRMHLEWTRKVSSSPVFLSIGKNGIYSLSQGKIALLSRSMQVDREISMDLSGAAHFKFKNGIFAVASAEGLVQIYSEKEDFPLLGTFSTGSQIFSLELLERGGKTFALVGAANQTLALYELPSGKLAWSFNSKGSAFMRAVPNGPYIWLDQDNSIVAIDIGSGKVVKSHKVLGNGAFIHIHGNTLYCTTSQKLLYAFPL